MKAIFLFLLVSLFSTIGLCQSQAKADNADNKDKSNIRKAVSDDLRLLLVTAVFEWPDVARPRGRFLRIDGDRKPSSSLRKRLKDKGLEFSSSIWGKGLRVWVSKLNWISDSHVEAEAGYDAGNMAAGGCSYKLEMVDGVWKITSKDRCFIS